MISATQRVFAERVLLNSRVLRGTVSFHGHDVVQQSYQAFSIQEIHLYGACSQPTGAIRGRCSFAVSVLLPITGYRSKTLGSLWRRPWRAIGAVINARRVSSGHGMPDHSP